MDTVQIECALRHLPTFAGVFPSDMLPHASSGTFIVNTDAHTEPGTHWLAIHLDKRSLTGYYFDSCDCSLTSRPSSISSGATASLAGLATLASCRASPATCAASTHASSLCTWTGVCARKSLSTTCSAQRRRTLLTGRCKSCSGANSVAAAAVAAAASAAPASIKR